MEKIIIMLLLILMYSCGSEIHGYQNETCPLDCNIGICIGDRNTGYACVEECINSCEYLRSCVDICKNEGSECLSRCSMKVKDKYGYLSLTNLIECSSSSQCDVYNDECVFENCVSEAEIWSFECYQENTQTDLCTKSAEEFILQQQE